MRPSAGRAGPAKTRLFSALAVLDPGFQSLADLIDP
jgi:hypothetical protein